MRTYPKKSNTRTFGLIGAVAVSAVAVSLFASSGGDVKDAADLAVQEELTIVADSMNAALPAMLDQNTRLESASAQSKRVFEYRFTIVGMEQPPRRYQIVNEARPKVVAAYRTAEDMQHMRDLNVIVRYVYSDEAGKEVARFEVGPEDV